MLGYLGMFLGGWDLQLLISSAAAALEYDIVLGDDGVDARWGSEEVSRALGCQQHADQPACGHGREGSVDVVPAAGDRDWERGRADQIAN